MDIPNREAVEKKVRAALRGQAAILKRSFIGFMNDPERPAEVPVQMWEETQERIENQLKLLLLLIIAQAGQAHGLSKKRSFKLSDEKGVRRAARTSQQFRQNSEKIYRKHKSRWDDAFNRTGQRPTRQQYREAANEIFGDARIDNLTITEVTEAWQEGSESGVAETVGTSRDDKWITAEDERVCPVCAPLNDAKRDRWSADFPAGPPAHPRCRCHIQYANEPALETAGT